MIAQFINNQISTAQSVWKRNFWFWFWFLCHASYSSSFLQQSQECLYHHHSRWLDGMQRLLLLLLLFFNSLAWRFREFYIGFGFANKTYWIDTTSMHREVLTKKSRVWYRLWNEHEREVGDRESSAKGACFDKENLNQCILFIMWLFIYWKWNTVHAINQIQSINQSGKYNFI